VKNANNLDTIEPRLKWMRHFSRIRSAASDTEIKSRIPWRAPGLGIKVTPWSPKQLKEAKASLSG
jgi:hypothetical protein